MLEFSWPTFYGKPLIDILILPPAAHDFRSVAAKALVDTGATTSAITASIAEELELPVIGKRPVASAHGEQQADRYLFRVGLPLERAGRPESPFPYILDDVEGFEIRSGFQFNALLGMDVLSRCELIVNHGRTCVMRFR